jgi:iron complex transport system permease protein
MTANLYQKKYFFITGVLVAAIFLVSLRVGRYPISLSEIASLLFGGKVADLTQAVFLRLRLPRTVMALLAGAGLGMAGSVFQLVFKNPLAAPEIVGVSNGANLGAALAIVIFGNRAALLAPSAFLGGMLVLLLVIALARISRSNSTVTYILAGIVMKAISDACIMVLKFFADPERELAAMEYWAMGSLGGITAAKLYAMLPFFLVGFTGLVLLRRQIALLGLEDDESRTLGVQVKFVRVAVLGFAALTVASIICQTGLISFIGLIAPHAARLALKRVNFGWCVLSAMTGAFILLLSDCLARGLSGVEIPISIPSTFIGVPILLYFMWKRKTGKV